MSVLNTPEPTINLPSLVVGLWQRLWKPVLGLAILAGVGFLAAAGWNLFRDLGESSQPFIYYTVTQSDLPLIVTERGNLEAQLETEIRCQVESQSFDRSGNSGTQIIVIVRNGSAVKKGDTLVELDSAAIRDRLVTQQLAYDKAVSQRIQAQATYDNQITQNETNAAQAALQIELAQLKLDMYMDEENGTFQLAVEDIERQLDESKNAILEARALLELEKTNRAGIEALFKLGYRGQGERDQSRLKFLQAEDKLASAVNRLHTFQATRKQLEDYELRMQRLTLDGDVQTAIRNQMQVKTDSDAALAKALAAKIEAEKTETNEKDRLDKLKTQLDLCKIIAPHDGMVVYDRENNRYGSESDIGEGAMVRERQRILTLPDLSQMQVKTQIHEAVLDQVRTGLPVTVKVDAFPNRTYNGIVHEVAVVPTSSYYTNVKTYDCIVRILERVEGLKPGMTAVVDIHIDRLADVISIPVQAVVQVNRDTWCYVQGAESIERRLLELGRSNDKFVHVVKGLVEGDRVILNTDAIFDESKDDAKEIAPDAGASEVPQLPPAEAASASPEIQPQNQQDDSAAKAPEAPRQRGKRKAKTE